MTEAMERKPFDTLSADGTPLWKKIYDGVQGHPTDTLFTFDELTSILGRDIIKYRDAIYQANKHLLDNLDLMLLSVKNQGYKLAKATDQLQFAAKRPKRAKRQLTRGLREAEHTNQADLSLDERKYRMDLVLHMQIGLKTLRKRQHKAIKTQEKALQHQKVAQEQIERIEAELKELKKSLR